jgi:hypothetical protein
MNLMLDACANDKHLRAALDKLAILNVCDTSDCGYAGRTDDRVLVYKGTQKYNKILLTKNIENINEHVYPPCGHGGIIVFHEQELKPDYVVPRIKALKTLGLLLKIKRHVTKIYDDKIEVHTLEGKEEHKFADNQRTKRIR